MNKNTASSQILAKDDLKRLATKDDLTKLATKIELKKTEKVLRAGILRVEEKVEKLQDGQERIEATLNRVANQLDGFVGRVDDLTVDNKVGANQIHELDKTTKNHEARITKLESPN